MFARITKYLLVWPFWRLKLLSHGPLCGQATSVAATDTQVVWQKRRSYDVTDTCSLTVRDLPAKLTASHLSMSATVARLKGLIRVSFTPVAQPQGSVPAAARVQTPLGHGAVSIDLVRKAHRPSSRRQLIVRSPSGAYAISTSLTWEKTIEKDRPATHLSDHLSFSFNVDYERHLGRVRVILSFLTSPFVLFLRIKLKNSIQNLHVCN